MEFKLTILGCSSATPTVSRNPSAQIVNHNNKLYLIDCGEGTQMQMLKFGIKSNRIDNIFISHLHGDHYLGLVGLLFTFHLLGRKKELHIYAPKELDDIISLHLNVANASFSYPLIFHPLFETHEGIIFENAFLEVSSFNLKHRIPTYGFLFKEKRMQRKIIKSAVSDFKLSVENIRDAKEGKAIYDQNGKEIPENLITVAPADPRSFAYCSDTAYMPELVKHINNVSLLYHEATFAEDMKAAAADKYHSTAKEAALTAKMANAEKLVVGHYSARYNNLDFLLNEAKSVFNNTYLGVEGQVYEVD